MFLCFFPLSFDFNAAACVLVHVFMCFCVFFPSFDSKFSACVFCIFVFFVFYCLLHILCVLWVFAFCEETVVTEEFCGTFFTQSLPDEGSTI